MARATVLAISLLLAGSAAAQEVIRCGTRLVQPGDTVYAVLKRCGEPDVVDGNYWFYDQGSGRLLKVLIFFAGKLERIEFGERQ
jgi:hypothetical protein